MGGAGFGQGVGEEGVLGPADQGLGTGTEVGEHLHVGAQESQLPVPQIGRMTHGGWVLAVPPEWLTKRLNMRLPHNSPCQELVVLKAYTVLFSEPTGFDEIVSVD